MKTIALMTITYALIGAVLITIIGCAFDKLRLSVDKGTVKYPDTEAIK